MARREIHCTKTYTLNGKTLFTKGRKYEIEDNPKHWTIKNDLGLAHAIGVYSAEGKSWYSQHFISK